MNERTDMQSTSGVLFDANKAPGVLRYCFGEFYKRQFNMEKGFIQTKIKVKLMIKSVTKTK